MMKISECSADGTESNHLLELWLDKKTMPGSPINMLLEEIPVSFEFSLRRHSSSYAFVRFHCRPSQRLEYSTNARWPASLDDSFVTAIENVVQLAIVDTLFSHFAPFAGCHVVLEEIQWDDIRSSELAFYEACVGAMECLLREGKWERNRR